MSSEMDYLSVRETQSTRSLLSGANNKPPSHLITRFIFFHLPSFVNLCNTSSSFSLVFVMQAIPSRCRVSSPSREVVPFSPSLCPQAPAQSAAALTTGSFAQSPCDTHRVCARVYEKTKRRRRSEEEKKKDTDLPVECELVV